MSLVLTGRREEAMQMHAASYPKVERQSGFLDTLGRPPCLHDHHRQPQRRRQMDGAISAWRMASYEPFDRFQHLQGGGVLLRTGH